LNPGDDGSRAQEHLFVNVTVTGYATMYNIVTVTSEGYNLLPLCICYLATAFSWL